MGEHGMKIAVGLALTKFIREIGDERTQVEGMDPSSGKGRMVSKIESLARTIWKMALGYEETSIVLENGKAKEVRKRIKPDLACISMLYDRLEGKVAVSADAAKKPRKLADKVSDQVKTRLNRLAVKDGADGIT